MPRKSKYRYLDERKKQLAADNLPLVWWFINSKLLKKNKIRSDEIDECAGFLIWHLCMAADTFNPSFGTKFSTYVIRGLHSGVCSYFNFRNNFEKHFTSTDFTIKENISIDNNKKIVEPEYVPRHAVMVNWENLKILFNYIDMTPIEEQIIFFYYEQKYSFDEIGDMMNFSGERIRQLHKNIVNKLSEVVKEIDITIEDFLVTNDVYEKETCENFS